MREHVRRQGASLAVGFRVRLGEDRQLPGDRGGAAPVFRRSPPDASGQAATSARSPSKPRSSPPSRRGRWRPAASSTQACALAMAAYDIGCGYDSERSGRPSATSAPALARERRSGSPPNSTNGCTAPTPHGHTDADSDHRAPRATGRHERLVDQAIREQLAAYAGRDLVGVAPSRTALTSSSPRPSWTRAGSSKSSSRPLITATGSPRPPTPPTTRS